MKEKFLNNLSSKIKDKYNYSDTKIKEIRYGLETIYVSIIKLTILLIISFFIHTTKEICIFYLLYALLRLTGFGLHAKNTLQCYLLTIPTFILIPYLIKTIILNNYYYYIIIMFIILLSIYAPADTEKRPLINKKKRIIYKICTIIISLIYFIFIITSNNYIIKNAMSFSIILETLLVLPISYRLLNLNYSNYKRYRRKEDIK